MTFAVYCVRNNSDRRLIDSLGKTGDLAGCVILMINALGSGLVDSGNSGLQIRLGSLGITVLDLGQDLTDLGLNLGLDHPVAKSLLLDHTNSFLCGLDICHLKTSSFCLQILSFETRIIERTNTPIILYIPGPFVNHFSESFHKNLLLKGSGRQCGTGSLLDRFCFHSMGFHVPSFVTCF